MHSYHVPLALTVGYLISLPILKFFVKNFLSEIDVKLLLKESMLLYNVAQVAINGWMVWRFIYAIWIHYCDKYLEFFDTYFMVLRGRTDQVSRLRH